MNTKTAAAPKSALSNVRPVPEGYRKVTPWIISRDSSRLIAFVKDAFDAVEMGRVENEDGSIGHAEVRIGDAVVMMFDGKKAWPDTPAFLRLYVDDADATFEKALKAGATMVTRVTHLSFGDRVGRVRDPLGNMWWIQTHVEDVSPEEMGKRMGEKKWIDAMRYVQDSLVLPSR